ncbi:MAG TPA: hypothetical protein VFH17_00410 [Coriobacteriia bacterium]|nr:hypothetical protein [Coriobacteriia bacterium]
MNTNKLNLAKRLGLCWRILRARPSNLLSHANRELPPENDDEMQCLMHDQLREMILVFSTHGHSGTSASYATAVLEKLLRYRPLRPLTGADDEWNEITPGEYQNNRCSRVFKSADRFGGQAYDIDAVVFRDSISTYTNRDSARPVVFPYWPETVIVDVPLEEGSK